MTDRYTIHPLDCRLAMSLLMAPNSVDSIVTDPPYELGFMGKHWDGTGVAYDPDMWREAYRVLKPGGYLLAFSGSRTYHRMVCAIEDAGFEIRDQIMWIYGSGFPKSLDVSKAIDKAAGAERTEIIGKSSRHGGGVPGNGTSYEINPAVPDLYAPATDAAREWDGWGTALKPAHEPIVVARKPLADETGRSCSVAVNVQTWGTGGLNIDASRVPAQGRPHIVSRNEKSLHAFGDGLNGSKAEGTTDQGRFPANVIHDGSDEVVALFPTTTSGLMKAGTQRAAQDEAGSVCYGTFGGRAADHDTYADTGSAARFFYCAKASKRDRNEGCDALLAVANTHPTVKPTDLMRYLCRMVTRPGGVVFDPFTGSGSTGKAALLEGFQFVGCEMTEEYLPILHARLDHAALTVPSARGTDES